MVEALATLFPRREMGRARARMRRSRGLWVGHNLPHDSPKKVVAFYLVHVRSVRGQHDLEKQVPDDGEQRGLAIACWTVFRRQNKTTGGMVGRDSIGHDERLGVMLELLAERR